VYGARPKRPYLLSGVAFCAACGSPLWANTTSGGRHNYYRCSSRSRGEDCSDGTFSCRAEHPENEMSSLFIRLELPSAWRERVKGLVSTGGAGLNVERERQRLNERLARVRCGLIDGILDNETAKVAIREAEAALHALPRLDGASVQAGESLTGIRELWPHMTGEERRDLVRLVLVKVEIDLRTGSVGGLIPKPAFAPLFRLLAEEEDELISVCAWRPRGGSGSAIVNLAALGRATDSQPCKTSISSALEEGNPHSTYAPAGLRTSAVVREFLVGKPAMTMGRHAAVL
jgi:hypothetical protein